MTFSIVLPCYNEILALPNIFADLENLFAHFELQSQKSLTPQILNHKILKFEIVFVDDGSTDGSPQLIENWIHSQKSMGSLKLIRQSKNSGYGAALIRGITESQGDWIGIYDCDATLDPKSLFDIAKSLEPRDVMGIGVRLHPTTEMPFLRKFGNRIFVFLVHILYGKCPKDLTSGMRVLQRKWCINHLPMLGPGLDFTLRLSLLALREKSGFSEIEVPYRERLGMSKLSPLREGWKFLMTIFRFRCKVLKHV